MKKNIILVTLLLIIINTVYSEEYFVDNNNPLASNSNPGTKELPFLTMQFGINRANQPGDVVYVHEGVYDERLTCPNSGNKENYINIVCYPGDDKPIVRGFEISGKHYIRIIGFEVTHNSTQYSHGFILVYGCSHIEILDNYIHHIVGQGVRWYNHNNTYITVRGNEIYMAACPNDSPGECKGNGTAVAYSGGNHNLVEYNIAHRVGDFINIGNDSIIVRNNYMYDFQNSYWTDGPGDALHADMFQPCGAPLFPSKYQIYESNFMGNNIEANSHILQMRTNNSDDHHIIFRGNVGFNHGSYAMQCGGVDNVYYYNNTIHDINNISPGNSGIGYNSEGNDNALNNQNFNNIFSEFGNGTKPPIIIETGCTLESSNNLCHLSGTHSSCASSGNPYFINAASRDYYPELNSSAIGIGKEITKITSQDANGTSFEVENSDLFCDGYGIAEGDLIRIGNNEIVRITNINGNTIIVNKEVSWQNGDGVFWRNQDSSPDAGAFEFNPTGYNYRIKIINPVNNETVSDSLEITTEIENPEVVRFVVFYIDGIPVNIDYDFPFTHLWLPKESIDDILHTIEARAYPLFASKLMIECDTVKVKNPTTGIDVSQTQNNIFQIIQNPSDEICIIKINDRINPKGIKHQVKIFNINGICVDELKQDNNHFIWNTTSQPNGIYLVQLIGREYQETQKFVLIR